MIECCELLYLKNNLIYNRFAIKEKMEKGEGFEKSKWVLLVEPDTYFPVASLSVA